MNASRRSQFEALFECHAAQVRGYASRRIGLDAADEVVAEVFVVAWRRLDDVPTTALPWLLACARRVIANQRRGDRRRTALLARLREHARPEPEPEPAGDLAEALAGLREADREVLMLVAWEGLSHADAARVLDCSERAFTMRLHRARGRLADRLAELTVETEVT